MSKILTKVAAVVSSGALVVYSLAPLSIAMAQPATSLVESGNGAGSVNSISDSSTQSNTVSQNSTSTIDNAVTANPVSGGNTVTGTTNGDSVIGTGNATAFVSLQNQANLNMLGDNRGTAMEPVALGISGNGALSTNAITKTNTSADSVFQNGTATLSNAVSTSPVSGNNTITNGTGGSGTIVSGHAASDIRINNLANANVANLGPAMAVASLMTPTTGGVTAAITGNGAGSDSTLDFTHNRSEVFVQGSTTDMSNAVTSNPVSGNNSGTDNTSGFGLFGLGTVGVGGLRIDSGNATSAVAVTNKGGLNMASDGNQAMPSTTALVSDNGALSSNAVLKNLSDGLSVFQGTGNTDDRNGIGAFRVSNALTTNPFSGENNATNTTLDMGQSAMVVSGHAATDTRVVNQGNVNTFGPATSVALPGGMTLDLGFNVGSLFGI